ncbi:MAG: corrinoid protein [Chloroflexi bacterium]|jgi:corrinoid protein of di/trimethylamine methyltransferase|nr:corrinoid protein [Chloroflexota bacterium]
MHEDLLAAMRQSIADGDQDAATATANQAIEVGLDPLVAIDEGYVPGLSYVGSCFSSGEMFLPDMMLAARAMNAAMAVLKPELAKRSQQRSVRGRVVIGTVKGDIHEIGKNLVGTMLSASGFEVVDLGVDVAPERFVDAARENNADIVGVSALLTTTMTGQRTVVESLAAAGLRPGVKVIVGGAPVTRAWAAEIGADGYSEDAVGAVALATKLMEGAAGAAQG